MNIEIKVDRLNQCPKIEQEKMLYMWIKQDVISLSEYREILKSLTSSSRSIDRRELLEDYTRNLKHQGVAIFTEEGVKICVDNYESSNSL